MIVLDTAGQYLQKTAKYTADVESRYTAVFRQCLLDWTEITFAAKDTVYQGLVLAILIYGAEYRYLTEKLPNR